MADINARLAALGIEIPEAPTPAANYVPYAVTGNTVVVSGQLPMQGGEMKSLGHLGDDVSIEQGYEAARLCAINLIAQVKAACGGDLNRVRRVVRLGGFVSSTPAFTDHPKVINGASDLMAEVFGDAGKHARAAVGVAALPFGVSVEVEGLFEID